MKYWKKGLALFLCAVLFLSACSTKDEGDKNTSATGGGDVSQKKELSLVLDWYPNAIHSFLYVGLEKGYYQEEGIDLKIEMPSSASDPMSLVAAGKADMGIYYQQDVVIARAEQNIPIQSIGSIVQGPLNVMLALKDTGITRPRQLEGKTIGYAGSQLAESLVKTMIESDGGDASKVELVDVGFDLMSSMTTKNVDATIGCMLNHEVPQLEKEGFPVNVMEMTDYGIPSYDDGILVVQENPGEEKIDLYRRFLRASRRAFEDVKKDPDAAIQTLLAAQNKDNFPLSEDVEKISLSILLKCMETQDAPFLSQNIERWNENIRWLHEKGIIHSTPEGKDFYLSIPE